MATVFGLLGGLALFIFGMNMMSESLQKVAGDKMKKVLGVLTRNAVCGMIMVFPLSRLIVGTTVGTVATIVPLVVAAFPFVARLAETSLREVSPNIIEAAQSMGASPFQIIVKVMIPESVPSLISNLTTAITTILGYSAMSGIIGGGGLGKIAINYGYYRYKYLVMLVAVILLIILVQIFQTVGTRLTVKLDRRLKR